MEALQAAFAELARTVERCIAQHSCSWCGGEPEGSDDYTQVPFDNEKTLRRHYTTHVMPPTLAYIPPPLFLTTIEPTNTLLMGDEVISTTLARENNELIKSSVDDLVPIVMESEVTSDSNLECDMPVNTPLPTTDVMEENFDINSPLGEHVEFEDISSMDPPKTAPLNYEPLAWWEDEGDGDPFFGFHYMPSPRPAAYSPKEVMYCYYHLHLTSGDGFDPEIKKIPSDESKFAPVDSALKKVKEFPKDPPLTRGDGCPMTACDVAGSDSYTLQVRGWMTCQSEHVSVRGWAIIGKVVREVLEGVHVGI
nr:hypothetical protein [Tanacetum cinerariifolium]